MGAIFRSIINTDDPSALHIEVWSQKSQAAHSFHHFLLLLRRDEKKQKPASSGTEELASDRSRLSGASIERIDLF